MDRIGIRELRQNASRYVDRAEAGETIEVTNRGRVVARLAPATASTGEPYDDLIATGAILPPASNLRAWPLVDLGVGPSLSEILDDMREDRL